MGIAEMNAIIEVIASEPIKDAEGFATQQDTILFRGRAKKNVTAGGSERFGSGANYSEELTTFRFRVIPGVRITTEHYIIDEDGRYNITKVDNVSGGGMYVTVTVSLILPAKG